MRGIVGAVLAVLFCACGKGEVAPSPEIHLENQDSPARARPAVPKWVAIGATASPWATQISIEEELLGVERLLGKEDGFVLFAGGPNSRGVLVADEAGDTLLGQVGDVMGAATYPSHFRPLAIQPHAAATAPEIQRALRDALSTRGEPLVVWLAGHGNEVATATEAAVGTWGGGTFFQADLAALLAQRARPLTLVATQCHGGGFAEALFSVDDACGAFSAPWSLPSSGCDSRPDAARTSYGALLLRALETSDHGLAEAHVAAVAALDIDTSSIDVPYLSSQIWLETWAARENIEVPADTPLAELAEEAEIVSAVATRHGLAPALLDSEVAAARLLYDASVEREAAHWDEADAAMIDVRAAVWARWPELESAWHPAFATTMERERAALGAFFESDSHVMTWRRLRESALFASAQTDITEYALRGLERVQVALRTQRLATLARNVPVVYERFERLRRCERRPLSRKTSP